MARSADRMSYKDKLVDKVSRAIKSVQQFLYYQSQNGVSENPDDNGVVITNQNRACHKLLDSLDHALLHGIRHVTHGYWRVVKELSHKGMIREIELLSNVTTDLGRGRAWLHASLNESLLESYIRLLTENEKLVKKHYAKDALVMDKDRMHVLLTLTSGLDFVVFQLEYDLPYLDLSPSPPNTRTDSMDEDDSASVQSSTIFRSSFSEPRLSSPLSRLWAPSDSDSVVSCEVVSAVDARDVRSRTLTNDSCGLSDCGVTTNSSMHYNEQTKLPHSHSSDFSKLRSITPTDSTSVSSFGSTGEGDRHQRLENIIVENELDIGDSLEVIHIRNKKSNSGKKVKRKKVRSNSIDTATTVKSTHSRNSQNSLKEDLAGNKVPFPVIGEDGNVIFRSETGGEMSFRNSDAGVDQRQDSGDVTGKPFQLSQVESGCDSSRVSPSFHRSSNNTPVELGNEVINQDSAERVKDHRNADSMRPSEELSSLSQIEQRIAALLHPEGGGEVLEPEPSQDRTLLLTSTSENSILSAKDQKSNSDVKNPSNSISLHVDSDSFVSDIENSSHDTSSKTTENNISSQNHKTSEAQTSSVLESDQEGDDNFDFYSSNYSNDTEAPNDVNGHHSSNSKAMEKNRAQLTNFHEASHLQDYMDYILKTPDSPDAPATKEDQISTPDLCVSLDNNMKLEVMLHIFKQEDENFIKMFVCWENHTEGDPAVAYVLISDQFLYILYYKAPTRKFIIQSTTRLTDIIFISTGLFDQTLNIESRDKSRQKQRIWLTPGYQALTQAIVECLSDAVKKALENFSSVRSRFSVGSDIPLQKIGIRKYISKQLNCEGQDIIVKDYSLVYWEDPSTSSGGLDAITKEGTLLLHSQDPVKGYVWKPVYVVLKSGMLCISTKKTDPKPYAYLGLGGDQCVGCRRTSMAERDYCIELVLAQAGSWFLSGASASEIAEWSHALCLAVSQGIQEEGLLAACTPCCAILACDKMFMCHEDLHTRFFRTLGSAQIEDVTGISIDEEERTYCIVEFESTEVGVTSNQWVFYFASASDASRFISALEACWKKIYQVDLPVTVLESVTLRRHCQNHVKHLRSGLTLL